MNFQKGPHTFQLLLHVVVHKEEDLRMLWYAYPDESSTRNPLRLHWPKLQTQLRIKFYFFHSRGGRFFHNRDLKGIDFWPKTKIKFEIGFFELNQFALASFPALLPNRLRSPAYKFPHIPHRFLSHSIHSSIDNSLSSSSFPAFLASYLIKSLID